MSEAQDLYGTSVLVVEDDATVSEVVCRYLKREGYQVRAVRDGQGALESYSSSGADLILLDLMLPGMDGLEVCRRLRADGPVPIVMLTALGDETDRVVGLELGADDYMTKPFSPRELVARIKSVLRRSPNRLLSGEYTGRQDGVQPARSLYGDGVLRAGRIEVRVGPHEVTLEGEPISLTIREFELLAFLMSNPRRVFTREELLERVWGYAFGDQSTVTVHVRRLREKIEVTPAAPRHVVTVWGVGYRFDP